MSNSVWPHRWWPTKLQSLGFSRQEYWSGCHFLLQGMKVKSESEVAQSCPTLCDPMDCSPPGSSVHGISQARVLEWGAIAFCRKLRLPLPNCVFWTHCGFSVSLSFRTTYFSNFASCFHSPPPHPPSTFLVFYFSTVWLSKHHPFTENRIVNKCLRILLISSLLTRSSIRWRVVGF